MFTYRGTCIIAIHIQFFDRDSDGVVRFEDICQALPIQGFPTLPKSKKRRAKKDDDEDVLSSEMNLGEIYIISLSSFMLAISF